MNNTKKIGEISEAKALVKLLALKKSVLLPFGDNQRFDLVTYDGTKFERVQVKTGHIKNGVIIFNSCSSTANKDQDYRNQADLFFVYCPENEKSYLIPVDYVGKRDGCLRISSPKNNQKNKIRLAKDFEV